MPIPLGAIAVAAAASVSPIPVNSYQAVVSGRDAAVGIYSMTEAARGLADWRARSFGALDLSHGDSRASVFGGLASSTRRAVPGLPDKTNYGPFTSGLIQQGVLPELLGRARAGEPVFVATTIFGRTALRATVIEPTSTCDNTPRVTGRIWISPKTLLPLRLDARQNGAYIAQITFTYRSVNAALPWTLFALPAASSVEDEGFVRASAKDAAGPLPYAPRVPSQMVDGFGLSISGWARRGQVDADPWLYQAIWHRGLERIDLTMRVNNTDWTEDPFEVLCGATTRVPVTIHGAAGFFDANTEAPPHLYWREGNLRYTLSGPFPKDVLLQIAESLHVPA